MVKYAIIKQERNISLSNGIAYNLFSLKGDQKWDTVSTDGKVSQGNKFDIRTNHAEWKLIH